MGRTRGAAAQRYRASFRVSNLMRLRDMGIGVRGGSARVSGLARSRCVMWRFSLVVEGAASGRAQQAHATARGLQSMCKPYFASTKANHNQSLIVSAGGYR